MRLARPTTRRLMVLVAVAALSLFGVRLWVLRVAYQRSAEWHEANEAKYRALEAYAARMVARGHVRQGEMAYSRARAERHSMLRRTYERAARFPWLPVPPDTPAPNGT